MGVWGAGLYSGDFAKDLRSAIGAVARLPFDPDKLVEILCETNPAAANSESDSDYTTFWLVIADQFAKRGMPSERARDKALAIIDAGSDLAMLCGLGMNPAGLALRRKMLGEVRERLIAPVAERKPRPVLLKPQPFLMDIGDVLAYPTFGGRCINPYFASKELDNKYPSKSGAACWTQDGWSALVIVDRGRAFGFLSWYRPLAVATADPGRPTLAGLRGEVQWKLQSAGTCSALHFKRLEFKKLGAFAIDEQKLRLRFPEMRPGTRAAVDDICISNALDVEPAPGYERPLHAKPRSFSRGRPDLSLSGIDQILHS